MLSDAADVGSFPSLSKFPHVMVTSLIDAVKYGSHEARLLFPRLLQIVALFPDTVNDFIHAVVCSSSSSFPRLISATADWMSAILPHMVWP